MPKKNGPKDDTGIRRIASMQPDTDTRNMFADLMKEAERGHIVGAIVVALVRRSDHDRRHYYLSVSGRAASNPTYATGAARACAELLAGMALKQAGLK